jgi:hypothetical protein
MRKFLVILTLAFLLAGCVEREWTINSEPQGAVVWVSGIEKGRTPVTFDFTWYGDYEVILRKDGYETLKTSVKLDAPPYEYVGVDFFSEIAPWTYHDRRETLHILEKAIPPTEEELKQRAKDMQQENASE